MFLTNLANLPSEILKSTKETTWILVPASVVCLALVCFIYIRSSLRIGEKVAALTSIGQVASCLVGALLSVFAFSLGGRPVTGVGVDARSFLVFNFWLVLAAMLAIAFCWARATRRQSKWLIAAASTTALALLVGHLQRAFDWSDAWHVQQQILAEAPIDEMKKMEPQAAVLLVKPFDLNGVPTFSSTWDINAAMPFAHPAVAGHEFIIYNHWLGPLSWNDGHLAYASLALSPVANLYVWRPLEHEFWKASGPLTINQDLSILQSK